MTSLVYLAPRPVAAPASLPPIPHDAAGDSSSALVASTTSVRHVMKIQGYSWMRETFGNGKGLSSRSFRVGRSTSWHMVFYPCGLTSDAVDFVSLEVVLDGADFDVKASIGLDVLDHAGELVPQLAIADGYVLFFRRLGAPRRYNDFIDAGELERLVLKDGDCFSIRCHVTVVEFAAEAAPPPVVGVAVPPPDWPRHFRDLLRSGQGVDVRFRVGGETFAAHRCVLAARSPVFRAELYGAMKEGAAEHCVRVDGIRPEVFTNLLHFVYTDSLPPSETEEEEQAEGAAIAMAQHLLVAADRYGIERLKLLCEDTLCRHMNVSTVATTLALAEQHRCLKLKEACFEFLLESPTTLNAAMATQGFDHLSTSCPSLPKELLMSKLAAARSSNLNQEEEELLPPLKKQKGLPPVDA